VESTDRQQVGEARAPPAVPTLCRQEVAAAEGEGRRHLRRADSVDVGAGGCEEALRQVVAERGQKSLATGGVDQPLRCNHEQRAAGLTTYASHDVDFGSRGRQIGSGRRSAHLEATASRKACFLRGVMRCDHPDPSAEAPPGIRPPLGGHDPRADDRFAVVDHSCEIEQGAGLAQTSTADQRETGEEKELEPRMPLPTEGRCGRSEAEEKQNVR
jgi:hypothetical protein